MSASVSITTIKIKLGNKEIELTADEAREIYGQLKLLFVQANENPLIITYPVPVYPRPIDWEPQTWPEPYRITYEMPNQCLCISQ